MANLEIFWYILKARDFADMHDDYVIACESHIARCMKGTCDARCVGTNMKTLSQERSIMLTACYGLLLV